MVNELTISFKDGALTGVQVRGADGVARAIQAGDLAAQLPTINEAALLLVADLELQVNARIAELTALKTTAAAAAQAVVTAVNDESISDAQTVATCKQIALQVLKPVRDREIEAAELDEAKDAAALAASSARVAALRAL